MVNDEYEIQHQKDLEYIRNFRLIDDDFLSVVFEDKECTELLLRIVMENDSLRVLTVATQETIKNIHGRSIRIDVKAVDDTNKIYDVEIQREDRGAVAKRARYNSSIIDANVLEPGEEYEHLNDVYVIFITENDVLGYNMPIYTIERTIRQANNAAFNDGSHIIYVNGRIIDDTALGKLMHDFYCTDPNDMEYKVLADRVRYFKEDIGGVRSMCRAMEEMRAEAAAKAAAKAAEEKKVLLEQLRLLGVDESVLQQATANAAAKTA